MNEVLVLGGTGFVGSHLVDRLAAAGHRVRVLSRSGRWGWDESPPMTSFGVCDLESPASRSKLEDELRKCAVTVHLSGTLFRPATPRARYRALHVDGTSRLVEAMHRAIARDGSARRLVHVSTTGVLGPTGTSPSSEDAPANPTTVYESTKYEGERVALDGRGGGLEVSVGRPGLVYGPRDLHLLGLWKAIRDGRFRLIAGGRALWQPVHVSDVAAGLERMAFASDTDGQVFHLAGPAQLSWREIAECVASSLSRRVRGPGIPFSLAWLSGIVLEGIYVPFAGDPPMSRSRARTFTQHRVYDISRARERLGWEPAIDFESGVRETTAWYREEGLL